MDPATLDAFVDHARSALAADPEMSARTTELRITQPFLEALGWDVHSPEVEAGHRVEDGDIGFALGRSGARRVFVETFAPTTSITREHARRTVDAMRTEGVESALLLNGREYWFVATVNGTVDYVEFSLEELPDHLDAVSYFDRDSVLERGSARDEAYRRAAERLSERREEISTDLADRLTAVAGEELRSDLSVAAHRFVDELVARLDVEAGSSDSSERSATTAGGSSTDHSGSPDARSRTEPSSGDGEFVVRFFDGGTSIGAIGASSQAGALHQTVTYLNEGRDLLRGLSVPWGPGEDDDPVVIAHGPEEFEETATNRHERLPGGYVLRTAMDETECRDAIEALAGSIGLRVMFQGDWTDD